MSKKKKAFTFIELMVAMTIFSIIATSIYYTVHTGIKVWLDENTFISQNQSLRMYFNILNSDLRNAVRFNSMTEEWTGESMTFWTILDKYTETGQDREIAFVKYYFDGDRNLLIRKCATIKQGFNPDLAEEQYILEGAESVLFEYAYTSSYSEGEYEWRNVWENEDNNPRAVKVTVNIYGKTYENIIVAPQGEFGKEE